MVNTPAGCGPGPTESDPDVRPPFAYYGGKTRLADSIAAALPAHSHYVEPFAGSLSVLLAKTPARLETVNDISSDLMAFWAALRDQPEQLARACALTPHSRAERQLARERPPELTDLERARRVWVCLSQGRTGTLANTGWRFDTSDHASTSMPTRLDNYAARIEDIAKRIRRVSLECRPALDVIKAYGSKRGTLLYVDPPYLAESRTSQNYGEEMAGAAEHRHLAEVLHECAATVVVSGYASELYDGDLYSDWYRHEFPASTSQGGTWQSRTEVLWSNRPLAISLASGLCGNETPAVSRCEAPRCGKVLRQPKVGRRKRYCGGACRVAAHRAKAA